MKKLTKIKELQLMANTIREDLMIMLTNAGSGHCGGPLGLVDIFTALYFNILKHDSKKPNWDKRDRLILSPGHVCPVRYAAMARAGYFRKEELLTLRKMGTRLQGHPSRQDLPGIELATASLGQGLGAAVGMALAGKLDRKKHTIYCVTSDGEHDEGNLWEAVLFAAKHKLDNLIVVMDRNYIQIDGDTEKIMPLDPMDKKYKSFNWNVKTIKGNNMRQVLSALQKSRNNKKRPLMIIANTIPGKGVSFMENDYTWHGKPPTKEQAEIALAELRKEKHHLEDEHCKNCQKLHKQCSCMEGQ